jgi:hypothetical protein
MRANLPELTQIDLRELALSDHLDQQGEEHAIKLDQIIRGTPKDAVIGFDLRGLKYIGYSYAKRAIRETLLRRNAGIYGDRRIILLSKKDADFLEGLSTALDQQGLFMLVSSDDTSLGDSWLIGDVPAYLQETFQQLRQSSPVPTGTLARILDQSPQNTKNRVDRLVEMGLVRREKQVSPTGGLEWVNWIL